MAGQQHVRGGRGGEARAAATLQDGGRGVALVAMDEYVLWGGQHKCCCGYGSYHTVRGGMPHPVSSAGPLGPTAQNSQEFRRLPGLDAGAALSLLAVRRKSGPYLLLPCFGSLPPGFLFYSAQRRKSLTIQGVKRDDASALALQGGGKTVPVLLG